jgi:hypothetical protein
MLVFGGFVIGMLLAICCIIVGRRLIAPSRARTNGTIDVVMEVDATNHVGSPFVVTGKLNLPVDTEIRFYVTRRSLSPAGPMEIAEGFSADCKLDDGGTFKSPTLGNVSGLQPGQYVLEVIVPIPRAQPDTVRQVIGQQGENLSGPLVGKDKMGVFVRKNLEFTVNGTEVFRTLTDAARRGSVEGVKQFLATNADVNELDASPNLRSRGLMRTTPLFEAVHCESPEIIQLLLDKGANLNARDRLGETALADAVLSEDLSVIKLLLKAGAEVNSKDSLDKTPLFYAAQSGNVEIVKILVDAGANVHLTDNTGLSPLDNAVYVGSIQIVDFLLKEGADINARDFEGVSPLGFAIRHHRDEIATILRKNGALE